MSETATTVPPSQPEWVIAFETWERFILDSWEGRSGFPNIREIFRAGWEAHEVISNDKPEMVERRGPMIDRTETGNHFIAQSRRDLGGGMSVSIVLAYARHHLGALQALHLMTDERARAIRETEEFIRELEIIDE